METKLSLAATLPGECAYLADVIADFSDHNRKRKYADWLIQQGDSRGEFLNEVLDQWDGGSAPISQNENIDLVWQRSSGITLLQDIRSEGLDSLTALFQVVRPALMINPIPVTTEIPVGSSKFGGEPDLSDGALWPEFDGKLHTFIGQINIAEIALTQVAGQLPPKGLLSFFVFDDPIETGQPAAEGEAGAWKVSFEPEIANLKRTSPPRDFDEGNSIAPELAIEFEETLDLPYASMYELDQDYADQMVGCRRAKRLGLTKEHCDAYEKIQNSLMPDREERSHLLGWSHPQVSCDDPLDEEYRNLLTVASEEACGWCWADGHQLYYGITEEDLKNHRFDQTMIIDG